MIPVTTKLINGNQFTALAGPLQDTLEDRKCLGSMIHTLMQRGREHGKDYVVERRRIMGKSEYWLWLASKHYAKVEDTRRAAKKKKYRSHSNIIVWKERSLP